MRYWISLALLFTLTPGLALAQVGDGRIYVREIIFVGSERIDDEVLRRELLQLEGTHVDTTALELSRIRIERLPYVRHAAINQRPVDNVPDQIDIIISIVESPARQYRFGGGYSESQRVSGFGYYVDDNFLGTGQRIFARLDVSEFQTAAELTHMDPYAHLDGVSRTTGLSFRRFDQLTADTTELEGNFLRAKLEYSYRIAERQSIRFGIALQDAELRTGSLASTQLENWVRENGESSVLADGISSDALNVELLFGWHQDTRDQRTFPSRGTNQQLNVGLAIPGSDIEYYTIDYQLKKYWPLKAGWTVGLSTRLGYGAKYGSKTTSLAPNLNWFAGGTNTVRGYRENRLGPQDSLGNPYGGNLLVANQLELMMPMPKKWREHARIGLFYDVGNVFSTEDLNFIDDSGQDLDYSFDFSSLRQSAGISAQVLTPLGIMRLSYGIPLNANDDDANPFLRDDIERFQLSLGVSF